jgi:hypothetical protein
VEIERSPDPSLSRYAIEIITGGPSWRPAKLNGYIPTDGFTWVDVEFNEH